MNLVLTFCGVPFVLWRIHFFTGFVESGIERQMQYEVGKGTLSE